MKSYKEFIRESRSSIDSIESICEKYRITNYTINSDGSIDVDGDVNLYNKNLTKIPLRFRNVNGSFICRDNQLTTLEGSPQKVGDFFCHSNKLTTLEGCPQIVSGYFHCGSNQLTTLEGCPKTVGGNFDCSHNQLITLEGGPKTVGTSFYCQSNKLISLKGSPQSINHHFHCGSNQLNTLEGCPKTVGGNFDCRINQLTTLEGCPQKVDGFFDFRDNQLINFKGFPEDFENNIHLGGNPVSEIYKLFKDIRCIKWLNEFDVIQDDKVILDRLEEVYYYLGIDIPKNIELINYEII